MTICGPLTWLAIFTIGSPFCDPGVSYEGAASYYWQGSRTANGERFNPQTDMTAAHRTLPFGTRLEVTSRATGRRVIVRVNDRGPFIPGRVLDLSLAAARRLGIEKAGVAHINYRVLR